MPFIGMLSKILVAAMAAEALIYAAAAWLLSFLGLISPPITLAVCAVVALGIRANVTRKMFGVSEHFRYDRAPKDELDAAGWRRLALAEYGAVLRMFCCYHPFEFLINQRGPAKPDSSMPILCVHGYVCNGAYWIPLKPALRAAGFHNLYTINMDPTFGSIEDFARQVAARVDAIRQETGAEKVALIGHSMGGLVSRCYVQHHGGDAHVSRIITLGTPHHGTVTAKSGPGEDARQMIPGNAWLTALNAEEPKPVPITSIWSTHDNIIAPQDSSVLPHADNLRLKGIGHLELSASVPVQQAVVAALRYRPESPR
ncbi:MAG: alpha/beta fold hydrolase [Candidatus Hydrogenedens sp.]|nr:alpha/beta fold hydrolase [Candidatus Hydrogenedens sp.]